VSLSSAYIGYSYMNDLKQLIIDYPDFRPTAGRCIVQMDRKPPTIGSLIVPEVARDLDPKFDGAVRDIAYYGTVVKMTPRRDFIEEFAVGDRVWLMLRVEDLGKEYVLTENVRVYARESRSKQAALKATGKPYLACPFCRGGGCKHCDRTGVQELD
jgi:hypothetical protein